MYLKLIIAAALSIPCMLAACIGSLPSGPESPPPRPAWAEALASVPKEFRGSYCQRLIDHQVRNNCLTEIALR